MVGVETHSGIVHIHLRRPAPLGQVGAGEHEVDPPTAILDLVHGLRPFRDQRRRPEGVEVVGAVFTDQFHEAAIQEGVGDAVVEHHLAVLLLPEAVLEQIGLVDADLAVEVPEHQHRASLLHEGFRHRRDGHRLGGPGRPEVHHEHVEPVGPRVQEPMVKAIHPALQHLDRRRARQRHRIPVLLVHHRVFVSPREREFPQPGFVAVQDLLQGQKIRPFLDDPGRRRFELRPVIEEVIGVPVDDLDDLDGLGRRTLARLDQQHEAEERPQPAARASFWHFMHAASLVNHGVDPYHELPGKCFCARDEWRRMAANGGRFDHRRSGSVSKRTSEPCNRRSGDRGKPPGTSGMCWHASNRSTMLGLKETATPTFLALHADS